VAMDGAYESLGVWAKRNRAGVTRLQVIRPRGSVKASWRVTAPWGVDRRGSLVSCTDDDLCDLDKRMDKDRFRKVSGRRIVRGFE